VEENFRIGTVAGVRIGANWSVLVIFVLVLVGLAAGRFPLDHPDLPAVVHLLAGTVAATLFFLSLLAHELAHAVVARHHGVQVEGITLWVFGGVAKLEGEPADPGADLRIAGVGPLVSLVLGLGFGALALLLGGLGITGIGRSVVGWLALINLALAAFNLVPAAPLDGGRLLRAVLWMRRGDHANAATSAARAGRRFGTVLVALGVVQFVMLASLGGLWFVLIGWFISAAAGAEEQHVRMQLALGDVTVGEVMTPAPTTVPPELTVVDLLERFLLRYRFAAYPVVDDLGRVLGLVTLQHVRDVDPAARATTTVARIASPRAQLPCVEATHRVVDLLGELRGGGGRALVVDEHDRLLGIVSPTDVSRLLEILDVQGAGQREPV
jgi:Zn-dependent protease/CBS domain-containing protein